MRAEAVRRAIANLSLPREVAPDEWAAGAVDYSRGPAYEVETKGPYNPDYMPYWREPMRAVMDRDVREVWVLKCARSGGSENLLLTTMRWALATRPQPMLYVSGQQQSVERFLERRIKPGFMLSRDTARKYRAARVREHEIFFEDCDLIATWPRNTMAFKQAGYSLIFGDEVSTWPDYSADMLRKRTDNWTFSHILCVSSPDPQGDRPSDEDPIFQEWGQTDKREWFCKDPATGTVFIFRLGGAATTDGIKWDESAQRDDGSWDIERVRETAHYITPDGTRIDSKDRTAVVRTGEWRATASAVNKARRGYHVTGFMVPFASGDFGELAARFLTAKHKNVAPGHTNQAALRGFMYEDLAEPFYMERNAVTDSEVSTRSGGYKRGLAHSTVEPYKTTLSATQKEVLAAVDVQKDHLWYCAREFVYPGDSALVEWRKVLTWEEALALCEQHGAKMCGIDYGFAYREAEVFRVAYETRGGPYGAQWCVPLKGVDRMAVELEQAHRDPFMGSRTGGIERVDVVRFRADTFRTVLMHLMRGEHARKWFVYDGIEVDYARQVTAMEKIDGRWKLRKGHSAEHLFDCEVMLLVVAKLRGLWDDRPAIGKDVVGK